MADYWTDFYKSVGIGGAPAPSPLGFEMQPDYTLDQIYKGIIPSAARPNMRGDNIAFRSALTTPPAMPNMRGNDRSVRLAPTLPPVANGYASVTGKNQAQLGPQSGYGPAPTVPPAVAAIAAAAPPSRFPTLSGGNPGNLRGGFMPPIPSPSKSSGPIQLQFEVGSDTSGQNMADSAGRAIVTPSGKTYTPRQGNGNARTMPQVSPRDMLAQRQGGLFGQLFGNSGQSGGGPLSLFVGGAPPAPSRPSAAPAVAAQQAQGLSPSDAYAAANQAAAQQAIANSANPSANAARASLASQWGFD